MHEAVCTKLFTKWDPAMSPKLSTVMTVSGSFNPPRAFLPLGGPGPALTSSLSPSSSLTYGPISRGNGPIYLMPGKPYNPNMRISGNRNIPSIQRYPQDEMLGGSNNMRTRYFAT
ncbi:unnamed protein product [Anisakis simplex]|uniref:Transducin-like enhancer protein 2 n=1 Tax=Anisakis simplex TaxID=6269 RepID=A0A0M3J9K6_ANISI|nr:unnamed protein product [Anisakis simplex]